MSLEIKGQTCPICKAYLFEEEDIAVCPTCGAPHHRECFVNAGKCGMEQFHGTDKQYDKLKAVAVQNQESEKQDKAQDNTNELGTVECRSCHNSYPAENSFCPHCGAPNSQRLPFAIKIDYLGSVKPEEDLGEGHKAEEVKDFVAVSTNRFIPKFKEFRDGTKVWFSVWHLLFPSASFAMRKMYAVAAVAGALEIAAALLMIPFNLTLGELMSNSGVTNYYALAQYMAENMDKAMLSNFLLATAGVLLQAFVRLMSALFANKLYYKQVIKTMSEIKKTAENEEQKLFLYRKRGGVNLLAFILVYLIISWLPSLIYSLI